MTGAARASHDLGYAEGATAFGVTAAVVAAGTWGFTGVLVRLVPAEPVFRVTLARFAIAAVALVPAVLVAPSGRRTIAAASRPGSGIWTLAALMVTYYVAAVAAYRLAPVAEVSLVISASPIFSIVAAWMAGRRPPTAVMRGATVGLIGIACIVSPDLVGSAGTIGLASHGSRLAHAAGDALALVSSACTAVYSARYATLATAGQAPDATAAALLTCLLGTPIMLAVCLATGTAPLPAWRDVHTLTALVALGVVCTALATVAYAHASARLPAVLATTLRLLTPLFSAVAALAVLGERPSWWTVPGAALILYGLTLAIRTPIASPTADA